MKESAESRRRANMAAGRTIDEQIEWIKKYGNHPVPSIQKKMLLEGLGISGPKPEAETVIIFGCYNLFLSPLIIHNYSKLLDVLGLEYTYLEKEYCCGQSLRRGATVEELEKVKRVGDDFVRMRRDLARQKGAKNVAYCCIWCAHAAKSVLPDEAAQHKYYFELLFDKLEQKPLEIAPTRIAYFEGCKSRHRKQFPGVSLDWERCRKLLDRIKGLEIVDLSNETCCWASPEKIVDAAGEHKPDAILCSCESCYRQIRKAARGKTPVKHLTELLLQAVGGES